MRMKVRIRTLFEVRSGTAAQIETAVQIDMEMPFPPVVGMDLLVDEDIDITITQVVFDHEVQRYSAWCEYHTESKGEIEDLVKRFVEHGWTHDPYEKAKGKDDQ